MGFLQMGQPITSFSLGAYFRLTRISSPLGILAYRRLLSAGRTDWIFRGFTRCDFDTRITPSVLKSVST